MESWLGKLERGHLGAGKLGQATYTEVTQWTPPADTEARHHKVVLVKIKDPVEAVHLCQVSCSELKEQINHSKATVLGVW